MWWILRRARLTGASLFSQASGTNNNNNSKTGYRNHYYFGERAEMEGCKENDTINDLTKDNVDNRIEWTPFIRQLFIGTGAWTFFFMFGLSLGAPTVIIAQIKHDNDTTFILTTDMESWLSSTMSFCGIPCVLIITASAYIFGRKITGILISLIALIGFIILYFGTTVEHLLVSQALHGTLAASQISTSLYISSEYISPRYRGMFFAAQIASMFWGIWVSNAIGTFAHWKNIGLFGLICALYNTISVSIGWPESPYWLSMKSRIDDCAKAHRWLKGTSESAENELAHLLTLQKERASKSKSVVIFVKEHTKEFFRVIWLPEVYKAIAFCLLFISTFYSSGKIVYTMYSIEMIKKITNSEHVAYIGMLILDGVTVFGMYCGCFLVKHLKRRTLLLVLFFISIVLLYSLSLYCYLIHLPLINENLYLTISLLVAFSLAVTVGPLTVVYVILGEFAPLKSRSTCVCLYSLYAKALMATMFKITPYMFNTIHFHGIFLVFGIFSTVCFIFLYKYLPETKDKTLIEISEILGRPKRIIRGNKEFILVKTSDDTI